MPKTLADGRIKLTVLTQKPKDLRAPTVDELKKGLEGSCQVLKSDYKLGATASETINEPALCTASNATVFGASNYGGSVSPFILKDEHGKTLADEATVWEALRTKGTTLWLVEREGPEYDKDYEVGDEIDIYEVVTDTPQKPSDRTGYIKRTIPLGVQNAYENVKVVAAAG